MSRAGYVGSGSFCNIRFIAVPEKGLVNIEAVPGETTRRRP